MKRFSVALIVTIVLSFFAYTIQSTSDDVRVGYVSDDISLSLDHEMTASLEDFAAKYELDKIYVSEEFYGDFSFNAVGLEWHEDVPEATSSELYIRFLQSGDGDIPSLWGDWVNLDKDTESRGDDLNTAYSFVMADNSEAFQYKVVMHSDDGYSTPYLENIEFQYIDSTPA